MTNADRDRAELARLRTALAETLTQLDVLQGVAEETVAHLQTLRDDVRRALQPPPVLTIGSIVQSVRPAPPLDGGYNG